MINDEVRKTVRGGRQMTEEEMESFLRRVQYGVLSYDTSEGWPDMRPLNIGIYNGNFYFHCNKVRGEKLQHLTDGKRVTLCMFNPTDADKIGVEHICSHESVLAYGHIYRIDTHPELVEEIIGSMTSICMSGGTPWKCAPGREDRLLHGAATFKVVPEYMVGKISCFMSTPPKA